MYRPFSLAVRTNAAAPPREEKRAGARSALALVRRARDVCGRVAKFLRLSSKGNVIAERPAAGELDAVDYISCKKENSKDMQQLCRSLKGAILLSTLRLRSPALFGRW
jgi:hypothetical protein